MYIVQCNSSIIGPVEAAGSSETLVIFHHIHITTSPKNAILQLMRVAKELHAN